MGGLLAMWGMGRRSQSFLDGLFRQAQGERALDRLGRLAAAKKSTEHDIRRGNNSWPTHEKRWYVTCRFPAKAMILGHPSSTETTIPASRAALPARVVVAVGSVFAAATGFVFAAAVAAAGSIFTTTVADSVVTASASAAAAAAVDGDAFAATALTPATVAAARSACAVKRL